MNDFDLRKYLAEGKLLKENLSSRAEELEMDFMDPRNKFGDEWQEQVSNVLVRKYDGHWENWENENPKELEMLLNKFKNLAEGKLLKEEEISPQKALPINSIAREIAKIIGSQLDPDEFYEYLRDYSKDGLNGEYGLDAEDLEIIEDAFDEVEQEALGQTNLNSSKIRSTELYKQYIKY
mgnify:FL=1